MQYQALYAQGAVLVFFAAFLVATLIVARRGVVAPLVVFGATILFGRAVGFLLNYLGSADSTPEAMQALINYARALPAALFVIYVCLMQARRYRVARNDDLLRVWFRRSPYVYASVFLCGLIGDLALQTPVLDVEGRLPLASLLVEAPQLVIPTVYSALAAFVFFAAVRKGSGPIGPGQRLQNLFFGVALVGLAAGGVFGLAWRGVRAFAPEALTPSFVERLSAGEFAVFMVATAGIVLGIFSYYMQGRSSRFVERFLSFLELVGDLSEELAGAPVGKRKLNIPYVVMHQAAGEEFLNLSAADRWRMDNAFCARVIWEHRADAEAGEGTGGRRAGRISRRRLIDLAKAYDEELREPVLAEGLAEGACGARLPSILRDLLPWDYSTSGGDEGGPGLGDALAVALKNEEVTGGEPVPGVSAPEWQQLLYVALADVGLLNAERSKAILEGRGVCERVLDTYRLARYMVHNRRGEGLPRIGDFREE